jgi:hypothetical protein
MFDHLFYISSTCKTQNAISDKETRSEGQKNVAEKEKDMERIRKTMAQQLADFDVMKKALMRDLQNRCEKVVELEISLDETREQYNNVLRNSNNKAQQKKMAFLERNLEQLTNVQKQVSLYLLQSNYCEFQYEKRYIDNLSPFSLLSKIHHLRKK